MAQLIRSAKSGSDWTPNELYAYNISITRVELADFFQGALDPSLDHLDPSILTVPASNSSYPDLSETTSEYLGYLDLATRPSQESAVNDFAAATLRLLGFREPTTIVRSRYTIPLVICCEMRSAQTDVCLIHRPSTVLLVLVEDKTAVSNTSPLVVEAQVVAGAIAAFQSNNVKREENGLPSLEAMTIPCITMSNTTPTFYLVPITKALSDAVITGQYPMVQTQVLKCTTIATHQKRRSDGMADLEFRKIVLKRFLAFRDLAKSHWQQYIF